MYIPILEQSTYLDSSDVCAILYRAAIEITMRDESLRMIATSLCAALSIGYFDCRGDAAVPKDASIKACQYRK